MQLSQWHGTVHAWSLYSPNLYIEHARYTSAEDVERVRISRGVGSDWEREGELSEFSKYCSVKLHGLFE
jgi:hypothetical protein